MPITVNKIERKFEVDDWCFYVVSYSNGNCMTFQFPHPGKDDDSVLATAQEAFTEE